MKTLVGLIGIVTIIGLVGCASTSQLEAVDMKASTALAQSDAALKQSEKALMNSVINSEKIDRMYTKLMSK